MVVLATPADMANVWMLFNLKQDILVIAVLATRMSTELVSTPMAVTAILARVRTAEISKATVRTFLLPALAILASAPSVTTPTATSALCRTAILPLFPRATLLTTVPLPTARAVFLPALLDTPALHLR